jgi:predicted PurR-regulated permease PerM
MRDRIRAGYDRVGGAPDRALRLLLPAALILAGLYFLRAVLIPLALAGLLSFLLSPLVGPLQRRLGRMPAVLVTVSFSFSVLGGIGWVLTNELTELADELPGYGASLRKKIGDLRQGTRGSVIEKVQRTAKDVVGEAERAGATAQRPLPVVVLPSSHLTRLPTLLEALASAGVVTVLVIFILLERQELRDRFIRLIGYRRMTATTKGLDEAAERISRYLLTQSLINGALGIALAVGLFLVGVPYAVLWGCVAAALRFVPYVGVWIAGLLPFTLALAVFPGWLQPTLVVVMFAVLELATSMFLEPWLWGQSAGISQVGLLVAVTFWTWIWGPIGLLLATPLTVCLVVIGKHAPAMGFLVVLIDDEPTIEVKARYYQRLLAQDQDEAAEIVEAYVKENGRETLYDEVLLPALYYASRDHDRGQLTDRDLERLVQTTEAILDYLASEDATDDPATAAVREADVQIAGLPARTAADALGLQMVDQRLAGHCRLKLSGHGMLMSEIGARVAQHRPGIVCIGSVAPGGLSQARHLCKLLRRRFPGIKIIVGRWGLHESREAERAQLLAAGADWVETTIRGTELTVRQTIPLRAVVSASVD